MFDSLSDKLQEVFKRLRGETKLTEENMGEALREVRRALLEADVSLPVVKDFIAKTKEAAIGQEVLKTLNPSQQLIKVVNDQLVDLLGGEHVPIQRNNNGPTVILMAGLQGSGKTTSAGKLGLNLRKQGMKPLLVACDIYRPAAIQQLQVLGKQIDVPVFTMDPGTPAVEIAKAGLQHAKQHGHNYVIIDTAGRLHIDDTLMAELKGIQEALQPQETLLVVDSMIGQDAVKMAEAFHQQVTLTGVILTKLDGDTRGGAALSVKAVTGCPIKFMATGEKIEPLTAFHPERIATRILGMGDVLTLIEKAQESIDEEEAKKMEQKLRKAEFTLEDFMGQMKMMKKIGSFEQIFSLIPGVNQLFKNDDMKEKLAEGEKHLKVIEAMISSMTLKERRDPDILNASRKARVARGSGTSVQEVNRLLKDFQQMKKMVKMLSSSGMLPGGPGSGKKKGKFKMPKGFPNFPGMPPM